MSLENLHSKLINTLQTGYDKNRASATWGAQEVSPFFFQDWREQGFRTALRNLVKTEEKVGSERVPAAIKTGMILAGGAALALGLGRFDSERKQNNPVGNALYEQLGTLAFTGTVLLLTIASGESPPSKGSNYTGSDKDYQAAGFPGIPDDDEYQTEVGMRFAHWGVVNDE